MSDGKLAELTKRRGAWSSMSHHSLDDTDASGPIDVLLLFPQKQLASLAQTCQRLLVDSNVARGLCDSLAGHDLSMPGLLRKQHGCRAWDSRAAPSSPST